MENQGSVVSLPHPLTCLGRAVYEDGFLPKETLGQYVERLHVNVPLYDYRVLLNGFLVPSHLWKGIRPRTGDTIIFQALVEGGGGGNKILRSIAMIAVAVLAAYTGGLAAGAYGAFAGSVVSGITMVAGTLLVNALLPPPKPSSKQSDLNNKEQEEQFSLSGGDNPIRPYEPMPIVFGRIKVAPDFSMKPYTEFIGTDQYLYQAFNFGLQPDLVLDNFKIGTNNITDYQELNLMAADASGRLPIAGNVDTQEGFDVSDKDGWITRTTSDDTQAVQIDFAVQAYKIDTATGNTIPQDCALEVQIRKTGTDVWYPCGDAVYYETGAKATNYWSYGYWTLVRSSTSGSDVHGEGTSGGQGTGYGNYGGYNNSPGFGGNFGNGGP